MAYAEGLQYEQIYWQQLDHSRQINAAGKVPRISCLALGGQINSGLI